MAERIVEIIKIYFSKMKIIIFRQHGLIYQFNIAEMKNMSYWQNKILRLLDIILPR